MADDDPLRERRRAALGSATRFLSGTAPLDTDALLSRLASYAPPGVEPDRYGGGELVEGLERRLTEVLGTEAAAFLPSGTLGQQAALRSWADRAGNRVVAMHGLTHLLLHEDQALVRLHGLQPVWLTHESRQPTPEDVAGLREPAAVLVVELPLRDAGYLLPTWDELVALVEAARGTGARVHLDGARLWESVPHLGHSCAEVVALFDSAYVSFYKGLEAPAGAAVVGPRELVEQVRLWQHRHGGTLFTAAPYVVAARHGLAEVLPRVPGRVAKAREVAAAFTSVAGVRVLPDPPHTNAFRVFVEADPQRLELALVEHAEQTGEWVTGARWTAADVPGWCWTEHTVMDGALDWSAEQVSAAMQAVLARARSVGSNRC